MTENNNRNKEGAGSTNMSNMGGGNTSETAGTAGGAEMTEGAGHPNGAQSGPPRTDGLNTTGAQSVNVPPPRTDGLNTAGNDNYVSTDVRS